MRCSRPWTWVSALFLHGIALAQGNLIPSSGLVGGAVYGPVQRTVVAVNGQPFAQGVLLRGTQRPANTYDAGLVLRTTGPLAPGDIVSGEIWIRRLAPDPGDAFAIFNFEKATPDYTKSLAFTLSSGTTNWTRHRFAFASVAAYPAGAAQVSIHLGFPPQTIEVGGLVLTNHARSRPLSDFPNDLTYSGREPDAPWRAAAAARIAEHRQALLSVAVTDPDGHPLPGARVSVRQIRHAFGFGTAADGARVIGQTGSAADRAKYQSYLTNWFNKIVLENDLKWPSWERTNPNGARTATNALNWFQQRGLPVRGHNLIWPGIRQPYFLPSDVPALLSDPAALRARIDRHFTDILGRTRGLCTEWDVINEPLHVTELEAALGRQELVEWFRKARAGAPDATLYLNEYENLESPTRDGTERLGALLRDLGSRGAPVDAVGLQSHFGNFLTSPQEVFDRITLLTSPGTGTVAPAASAQITELDINVPDESFQAEYLRDFMTVCFSHPKVTGIMLWGFWAGAHWLPDAALIRQNWQVKPSGQMWTNLVSGQWWTQTNFVTDAQGLAIVRAFKGDYRILVTADDETREQDVTVDTDTPLQISLPVTAPALEYQSVPDGFRIAWSGSANGYSLEGTASLHPAVWESVATTPVLIDGRWTAIIPPQSSSQFIRLRK